MKTFTAYPSKQEKQCKLRFSIILETKRKNNFFKKMGIAINSIVRECFIPHKTWFRV